MPLTNQTKNQHLMWRAGFGPAVEQLADLSKYTPKQIYKALVKASDKKPEYVNVADDYLQGLYMGIEEVGRQQQRKELTADERKMVQQKNREGIRNLNIFWLYEMVNSSTQLREKMAFFWHGHFACRNLNVFFQQGLLDVIRRNALGNFGTLLKEVSKNAAMLNFLNNQQNRKDRPNENFAREVMELFTLGRGNYTEHDVKEAARAFTGWSATIKGDYIFRKNQHDFGSKTVLGKTGNFDGEEVLDILLQQKETAKFVTKKLYKFLVNEQVDDAKAEWLADRFYKNEYDISKLLEDIFTSDWFYEEKNIGVKIKSPVELLAGIQRMLPMKFEREEALLLIQRSLGQLLFYPPNVAGWPGGKNWIDSSTLMMRMRIPQMLDEKDEFNIKPKDDDDQMMGRKDANEDPKATAMKSLSRLNKPIQVDIDWSLYTKNYESVPRESLLANITEILLQAKSRVSPDLIKQFSDQTGRENFIKTATLQIMSTPEYQLC
ncbi:MAG: DUF1800 domain-containing protein [Chitinophagaceae bacterium]|nr:DUF1800 domain-containing protein [Chitinophagaceae bacterium]MBK8300174.1 DUF1800 domain-containing protein [Chitinophagaceae bacterium]MBK9464217.1 DUF1800 domain-containing protein [Chitinophagaceae bacterium]MBK9658660.1 DUF1800 domain-containing protein [Chitinophagaceae bacterium]MBP6232065.1 DUF1800 domain-containing protein [Chitinophagaceae bacterium]